MANAHISIEPFPYNTLNYIIHRNQSQALINRVHDHYPYPHL